MWYQLSLARLGLNDTDGYRTACAEMLEELGKTENPAVANLVAWTCVLGPDAVADFSTPVALAKKAVQSDPESSFLSFAYVDTLGAILYRAGEYEEAIGRLAEADQLVQDSPHVKRSDIPASTWFFLAMAHHAAGHHEEANKWFKKAVEWTDKVFEEHDREGGKPLRWTQRLTLKLLRQEAEALVKASGDSQQPETPPEEKEKPSESKEKS